MLHRIRPVAFAVLVALGLVVVTPRAASAKPPEAVANPYALMRSPTAIVDYLLAVDAQLHWYFGVAQQAKLDAAAAAASSSSGGGGTGSGYHGPHTDAWWSGVAQCEQGGRNDSYFGFFSFMDGSQGGRPWADQVAAGNALLARAGREVGPWAAKCVAAGYAASPGG